MNVTASSVIAKIGNDPNVIQLNKLLHTYHGIRLSNKKGTADIYNKLNTLKNNVEYNETKRTSSKGYIMYDSTYINYTDDKITEMENRLLVTKG